MELYPPQHPPEITKKRPHARCKAAQIHAGPHLSRAHGLSPGSAFDESDGFLMFSYFKGVAYVPGLLNLLPATIRYTRPCSHMSQTACPTVRRLPCGLERPHHGQQEL